MREGMKVYTQAAYQAPRSDPECPNTPIGLLLPLFKASTIWANKKRMEGEGSHEGYPGGISDAPRSDLEWPHTPIGLLHLQNAKSFFRHRVFPNEHLSKGR